MERNPKIVSLGPDAMYATAGMIANRGQSFARVEAVFNEAFDEVEQRFPDIGTMELHDEKAAGSDNGAGSERQFAYCQDGDPIIIAFAPKATGLTESQLLGLMRHEFGHALEYRYGVAELERVFGKKFPAEVERRADAIAEAVWGEPIKYDSKNIQCFGRGKSPRPAHLPDAKEKLKANAGRREPAVFLFDVVHRPVPRVASHGASARYEWAVIKGLLGEGPGGSGELVHEGGREAEALVEARRLAQQEVDGGADGAIVRSEDRSFALFGSVSKKTLRRVGLRANPPPGKTFTAYHASTQKFDRPTEFRAFRNMDFGPGFYMATDAADTESYGLHLYEAEVRLENPIVISPDVPVDPELLRWFQRVLKIDDDHLEFYDNKLVGILDLLKMLVEMEETDPRKLIAVLQKKGYDGIYVDGSVVGAHHRDLPALQGDYLIIWSPDQILSWKEVRRLERNPRHRWHFEGVDGLIAAMRDAEPNYAHALAGDPHVPAFVGDRVRWLKDSSYVVEVPVEKVLFMEGNIWNFNHAAALKEMIKSGERPTFGLPAARFYRIDKSTVKATQREYKEDELSYQRGMEEPWDDEDAGTFYVQLLNGNHRALAAMAAGESTIFVTVGEDYRDNVREEEWVR